MACNFEMQRFEAKFEAAIKRARLVLDEVRDPQFAGDAHHQYQDKYFLSECMTNAAIASQINCLSSVLGISPEQLGQLQQWAEERAVSLRFSFRETCEFHRKEERDVKSPTQHVTEGSLGGFTASLKSSVVTRVTEFFWTYTSTYDIVAVRGVGESACDCLQLVSRSGREQLKTSSERAPRQSVNTASHDVNISWLLKQLAPQTLLPRFSIDRLHDKCQTPRRNKEIEAALRYFADFADWAARMASCLLGLFQVNPDPAAPLPLAELDADLSNCVSVLPLLASGLTQAVDESPPASATGAPGTTSAAASDSAGGSSLQLRLPPAAATAGSAVLGTSDTNCLLAEELRSLRERGAALERDFPGGGGAATAAEAALVATLRHCSQVCRQWGEAFDYLEHLLRKQLIAAIGKEVSPADFAEYMCFHNRKLFADGYLPIPFCFPVRRSEQHSPEGTVSIEEQVVRDSGEPSISGPISTVAAKAVGQHPMQFPLGASTTVSFGGDRYLHAWLSHQFSMQSAPKLSLVSRARQFSSMIVLVGRIASATAFEPKYAAIVQNKDELTIPLDLSTIPTPKEFKDAIESLSPEQQAFAKAFRSMQLESTLFGILVIQIKPQLEKVLNLPENSLTKEIKLTQELMQLFIKYQIPSDLLSFDAEGLEMVGGASAAERLEAVRSHVAAMQAMIDQAKKEEVEERHLQAIYANPYGPVADAQSFAFDVDDQHDEVLSVNSPGPNLGGLVMGSLFGGSSAATYSAPLRSKKKCMRSARGEPPIALAARSVALPAAASAPPAVEARPPQPQQFQQLQLSQPQQLQQPQPPQQPLQQPSQQPHEPQRPTPTATPGPAGPEVRDYTQVPRDIDSRLEQFDSDRAVRPTIISAGDVWTKRAQKALLGKPTESTMGSEEQKSEKDAAFDLLDALTKSGALAIEQADLHVVVAATHCFDKTVTETLVQDNANPIEKVERSTLIMASAVHSVPPAALVRGSQLPRVRAASPALFLEDGAELAQTL